MAITGTTDLGRGLLAVTVDADPTVTAVDAPAGSLMIFGTTYYTKLDSGVSTNVSRVAVGGGPAGLSMDLGGQLDAVDLPLAGVGTSLVAAALTASTFRARRGTAGTSGTTTIQLRKNGAAVVGATLSWTPADPDQTEKTVVVSTTLAVGDRLDFSLTAAEAGAEDLWAVLS